MPIAYGHYKMLSAEEGSCDHFTSPEARGVCTKEVDISCGKLIISFVTASSIGVIGWFNIFLSPLTYVPTDRIGYLPLGFYAA